MKLFIIIFLMLISCQDKKVDKEKNQSKITYEKQKAINHQDIDIEVLKKISLKNALDKYGKPKDKNLFNLNNVIYTEFRIELYNIFTKEQLNDSIPVKEITWKIKNDSLVTVWYQEKNQKWQPINLATYSKFAEF